MRWATGAPPQPYLDLWELIYRKWPPAGYIASTAQNWTDETGLALEHEPGVFPRFGPQSSPLTWRGGGYVAMVAHGKTTERGGREWGWQNWAALADELARHVPVVQVGKITDRPLRAACGRYLGRRFLDVARVLCGARYYVGPENGIAVLAGFLGVPHAVVYDGYQTDPPLARQDRLDFARELKIVERLEVLEVLERLHTWEANSCP